MFHIKMDLNECINVTIVALIFCIIGAVVIVPAVELIIDFSTRTWFLIFIMAWYLLSGLFAHMFCHLNSNGDNHTGMFKPVHFLITIPFWFLFFVNNKMWQALKRFAR